MIRRDVRAWSARALLAAAAVAFLGSLALAGMALDRYPDPYWDEAFFNYPAIRYLEGDGFNYRVTDDAPHWAEAWGYHGPLYPRLQVLTFATFGVSYSACRLPQFLAAHLAVVVLCLAFLKAGGAREAAILALAWVGDRSAQEVVFGRMEGLALLCLACGFPALVSSMRAPSLGSVACMTGALLLAAGFHPLTLVFLAAAVVTLHAFTPRQVWSRIAAGYALGSLLPGALVLACWSPHVAESVEQFFWHARRLPRFGPAHLGDWPGLLAWSGPWCLALAAATVVLIGVVVRSFARLRGRVMQGHQDEAAAVAATAFGLAGLYCALRGGLPYYLVYFTVWPVVGLLWMHRAVADLPVARRLVLASGLAVALPWLGSLAWNVARQREAIVLHAKLGPETIIARLRDFAPAGTAIDVDPVLFVYARQADLDFDLLPFFGPVTRLRPDRLAAMTTIYTRAHLELGGPAMAGRECIDSGPAFPRPGTDVRLLLVGRERRGSATPEPGR